MKERFIERSWFNNKLASKSATIGGLFGNPQNKQQQANTTAQTQVAGELTKNASFAADQAKQTLPKAEANLNQSSDFWNAILKGSGSSFDKFAAPTKASIDESFDAARKTISEFGPRGGGVNSGEADLENKRATSLSSLVFGAQEDAANQITNIGSIFGSLGTNELNSSVGGNQAASSTYGNINSQISADRAAQAQRQSQLGSALGNLLLMLG